MELCWISAWAGFLAASITGEPAALSQILIPFLLGTCLGLSLKGARMRVLTLLLIHAAAMILVWAFAVHYFQYRAYPLFELTWIKGVFTGSQGFMARIACIFISLCASLIYFLGLKLVSRKRDHVSLCIRFDIGLAAFFVLYLTRFLIEGKGGVVPPEFIPGGTVLPFFLFSLLAMGIAANKKGSGEKSSSGSFGAVIAFSIVLLSFASGLVLFFLPYLKQGAQVGFLVIKTVSRPFEPVIMAILRFMFQPRNIRTEGTGKMARQEAGKYITGSEGSGWVESAGFYIAWALALLLAIAAAAALLLALWYLVRWLLSKRRGIPGPDLGSEPMFLWISRILPFFASVLREALARLKPFRSARDIFCALQRWGNRSGIRRYPQETAIEYGAKLDQAVPSITNELILITHAFNEEIYGGRSLTVDKLSCLRSAFRRLGRPSLWPRRVRLKLLKR